MSELDDRIRDGLERLARPAYGSETLDDVARRRRRYRAVRRARAATLAVAVVVGSAAGVWALSRAFNLEQTRPAVPGGRNGLIAFSAQTENGWDIFVVNPDGTGLRPLVAGPNDEIHPVWSPDGTRLALVTRRERMSLLHVVDANGSGKQDLYAIGGGEISSPTWSPNGENIAVIDSNGLLVVPRTSLSKGTPYGAPVERVSDEPDWSPEGSRIAFVREDASPEVYLWDVLEQELTELTDIAGTPSAPAWSPDGSHIAFVNGWEGKGCPSMASDLEPQDAFFGVHIVDVERGITTRLSDNACHHSPAWSPDGARIAFVSEERSAHWVEVVWVDRPEEAYVMHPTDAEQPAFAWSPDGKMIAVSTPDSIRVAPIEGQSTEIVSGIGAVGDISWQPVPRPAVGPTPEPSPSGTVDPNGCRADGKPFLESYRPIGSEVAGSVLRDGHSARIRIIGDEERPTECRYFVSVESRVGDSFYAAVPTVEGVPSVPEVLMAAEIDGEPGHEVVVDFGGPGHPHRTGLVFTLHEQRLVMMRVRWQRDPGGVHPSPFVPLSGEFAVGIDCSGEPGTIVATSGSFADEGNDDRHYDITREFYRADGAVFEAFDRETFTVEVGKERELWPEIADDPFRSCPR